MPTLWRVLATASAGLHYLFLAYLILGGFLAWRVRRSIVLHLAAACWAVLILATEVACPLTSLQNVFRRRAGQDPVRGGFIEHYARGTLYPTGLDRAAQIVVAVTILLSWGGYVLSGRRRGSATAGGRTPQPR